MRKWLIVALVLLVSVNASAVDDLWSTAISERPRDGWKIILRFIEKLGDPSEKSVYPVAVTFTWAYDGLKGLPSNREADAIYRLEDLLEERFERNREGKLALVATGNNLRMWIYYVKSEDKFRQSLAEAASLARLKVDVSSQVDKDWALLEDYRKGVRRP